MKKHLLLLAVAFGLATVGFSQEKEEKEKSATPPAAVKAAFEKGFPGATKPKWEKEDGDYEVGFADKGNKMTAVYDAKGVLKETEVMIKESELPAAAAEYLKLHYKGATIHEAARITKPDGTINYEAEVNKKDVIFDAKGKFIKEEKD